MNVTLLSYGFTAASQSTLFAFLCCNHTFDCNVDLLLREDSKTFPSDYLSLLSQSLILFEPRINHCDHLTQQLL